MPKLYLISAEPSAVCLFYYDDTIDVLVEYGASDVIGRVEPFADGSVAYDKNGDLAIWAKPTWTKIASGGGGGTKKYTMSDNFNTAILQSFTDLMTEIIGLSLTEDMGSFAITESADIEAIRNMVNDMSTNSVIPLARMSFQDLTAVYGQFDDGDGNETVEFHIPLFTFNAGGGMILHFEVAIKLYYNHNDEQAFGITYLRRLMTS